MSNHEFVTAAKVNELEDGAMKAVKIKGREILLARVGDRYYASANSCPHMAAKLSQGVLEGTVVTCPRHASKFDLTDGSVIRWTDWTGLKASLSRLIRPPRPLRVYQIKIEGDDILVRV